MSKFNIDALEERIAPSSVSLGSLADGLLGGANASGIGANDSILSSNDPSVANNTLNAVTGNNVNLGAITGALQV